MAATTKWIVDGENSGSPSYGHFDYTAVYTEIWGGVAKPIPTHVKDGICFTLNCAWLQQRKSGLVYPQWRFKRLKDNFRNLAGKHKKLKGLEGTARAAAQVKLFDEFGLERTGAEDYKSTGSLGSISDDPTNPWQDFKANAGDVWTALATWIAEPELREKYGGPVVLSALIAEYYLEGDTDSGHSIAIDLLKTRARIFDMNEGEYEMNRSDMSGFFKALNVDNKKTTKRIDIHPFA